MKTNIPLIVSLLCMSQAHLLATTYAYKTIDIPGSTQTVVTGINNLGEMAGYYFMGSEVFGFSINSVGSLSTFAFPGATSTVPTGINDGGQIVGWYEDPVHGQQSFLKTSGIFDSFSVPGATATLASGINNNGVIVGTSLSSGGSSGFLLRGSAAPYELFNLPGASDTRFSDINNLGQIVGGDGLNGFLLDAGNLTLLGPGFPASINDFGDIVGSYADFTVHGYLLIDGNSQTFDFPGSTETEDFGVNNKGQVVGFYLAGGPEQGFVATPVPEPATAAFTGCTLIAMVALLRKRVVNRRSSAFSDC